MLRISLLATAFYFSVLSSFSQAVVSTDSTSYQIRKLKFEEVNFLTSYYHQEGNNAAVTGGIGSEKLTDFATTIDVRLSKRDRKNRLHSFAAELGIDYYSSASSDKVDPLTISSASSSDVRIYPTLSWSVTNEEKSKPLVSMPLYHPNTIIYRQEPEFYFQKTQRIIAANLLPGFKRILILYP